MIHSENPLKNKLASDQAVIGIWSIIPSPIVVEIFGLSGLDFVILDMEHGQFDMSNLDNCIRACESASASPIVRIPGLNLSASQWVLDMGAHGIVVPQLAGKQEVEAAVGLAKYAPVGSRGYNPFTRAANYANPADATKGKLQRDFPLTCAIVENQRALDELADICRDVPVDVIYMGIYDLAISLGFEGNTKHPEVVRIVEQAIRTIRGSGKAAGMMVRSPAEIAPALALGANFLVYAVDTFLIRQTMVQAVADFKKFSSASATDPS